MQEVQIKETLLFFYLFFLNEQIAVEQTIRVQKKHQTYKKNSELSEAAFLIAAMNSIIQDISKKMKRKKIKIAISANIARALNGGQNFDFNAWKSFQANAEANILSTVIWSKILKFQDEDIANGLEVSVGTIRTRVNIAIQELDQFYNFKQATSSLKTLDKT